MIPKLPYHPVTVVGGGIIGKLVALSLGRILAPYYSQPLLLVTRDKPSAMTKPNSVSSNRVSFLTPGSVRFFQELGIWRKICLGGAYPISSMKIFNGDIPGILHPSIDGSFFSLSKEDCQYAPFLGYIISNSNIEHVLEEEIKAVPITMLHSTKLFCINVDDGEPLSRSQSLSFSIENSSKHEELCTSLLLGCDGSNSFVRQSLSSSNFPYHLEDYKSFGVISTFTTSPSTKRLNGTAYQRYLPSGPLAALPLSPNSYSLVWSIPNEWKSNDIFKDKEKFTKLLNLAFYGPYCEIRKMFLNSSQCSTLDVDYRGDTGVLNEFGAILDASEPEFFPLKSGIVPSSMSISNKNLRVLLMGDAAHSIHPHAGQGLNMGIADAMCLHKIMRKNVPLGTDPGYNGDF
ncbi:ubiquinone biosynthesis monooxygenase Coq6 [Mitosporidium daphniae]|uniref:Ubiquinone biosynthesis monooxygenase Coq6 n=1 Tax=Mitosporidium daphniae TaxID=1485682 RepID=A0A098VXG1_9MICR|nr:ubiquinone biosynthesis monooxygenase Coq6 [Mitosporidium daphniae]|eukprot:XP_013238847.1 ubiquinone biosynthesis monooxygenase Coq6 [Mitosporidium daphniae]